MSRFSDQRANCDPCNSARIKTRCDADATVTWADGYIGCQDVNLFALSRSEELTKAVQQQVCQDACKERGVDCIDACYVRGRISECAHCPETGRWAPLTRRDAFSPIDY